MEAAVVNQFLAATVCVLRDHFSIGIHHNGQPHAVRGEEALEEVTVLIGITGDLEGHFLLACSTATALGLARNMLINQNYPEFDDLCASALCELGNIIAGSTMTRLSGMGHSCNLLPPTVLHALQAMLQLNVPIVIKLPLETSVGSLAVCIGLRQTAHG